MGKRLACATVALGAMLGCTTPNAAPPDSTPDFTTDAGLDATPDAFASDASTYAHTGVLKSNFCEDTNGWQVSQQGDTDGGAAAMCDNGERALVTADLVAFHTGQFIAPWKGNLANYYNGLISFELQDIPPDGSTASSPDLARGLELYSDDKASVYFPLQAPPRTGGYRTYFVWLSNEPLGTTKDSGVPRNVSKWKNADGTDATSNDFFHVLYRLKEIRFGVEYSLDSDTGYLRNVILSPP